MKIFGTKTKTNFFFIFLYFPQRNDKIAKQKKRKLQEKAKQIIVYSSYFIVIKFCLYKFVLLMKFFERK